MSPALRAVTLACAVGSGAVGGVFFAFSTFVMTGLRRLPAAQGVAAMQAVNVTAVRPGLMTALFGTAAGCVALTVHALRHGGTRPAALLLTGSVLYLVGVVGVTAARNVPLNDALAVLDPGAPGSPAAWHAYLDSWTRWNHVRTVTGLAAAAALTAALVEARTA